MNVKIAHLAKKRAASVLCQTDCCFAVMNKSDYRTVLDNIDRRKIEQQKDFFKQIPFFSHLSRSAMTHLHLSLVKRKYQRGQYVCKEGEDSHFIFIICKGEYEVSKIVDASKANQPPKQLALK